MDRHFLMQSDRHRGWFCGKCGKRLVPDFYNAKKHAEACGFTAVDEGASRNVARDHEPGYRISTKDGDLRLEICYPELVNIPGFQDRFHGLRWVPVMETVFQPDQKEPVTAYNQSGMDLDLWLSLIRAEKCCRIHDADVNAIREVFPGIIGLYSLQMFVHIYRTKGYRHVRLLSDQSAQRILMTDPARQTIQTKAGRPGTEILQNKTDRSFTRKKGKTPLQAALLRGKGDTRFLRVTIGADRWKPAAFLFSRGYAACTPDVDISGILHGDYALSESSEAAVHEFADLYPEYNLAQYLEKSSNILVPLIAPDYHNLLELSAKAAIPVIAENMMSFSQFGHDPSLYTNLRDAFDLPLHVLRGLQGGRVDEQLLKKLSAVNHCNPGFLQFDRYTDDMLDFYQCLRLPASSGQAARKNGKKRSDDSCRYQADFITRDFTGKQVLQILRYLYRREASWELLRDYIHTCELLGEYPYGFLPGISLREAHDRTAARFQYRQNLEGNAMFRKAVHSEQYQSLTTGTSEEDLEMFSDEVFVIVSPEEMEDLFRESEAMHNCVRTYSRAVLAGQSKIYFLRRKEDPEASFGTIEVRENRLVQAKGFANRKLGKRAQEFIRKWCTAKHLQIRTRDISPLR